MHSPKKFFQKNDRPNSFLKKLSARPHDIKVFINFVCQFNQFIPVTGMSVSTRSPRSPVASGIAVSTRDETEALPVVLETDPFPWLVCVAPERRNLVVAWIALIASCFRYRRHIFLDRTD